MSKGINQEFLDPSVHPGDDFYQFVNGGWMHKAEIPADRSSWGSFHELSKDTDHKVLDILDEALATPGPAENKAARLFESGMATHLIESQKLTALRELFEEIESITHHDQLPQIIGHLTTKGFGVLIQFSVHPDLGNSSHYSAYLEPANLGLPEREFYLDQDEKANIIRKKYHQYITDIVTREAGFTNSPAEETTEAIFLIEHQLASHMIPKEERRQIEKLYNPYSFDELQQLMPEWGWSDYFEKMNISVPARIIVTEPAFFAFINSFQKQTDLKSIKQYLQFMLMQHAAPYAHSALEEIHFDLYAKTLEGIQEMRPRNERLVRVINQSLGDTLGELFVSKHFPPAAKITAMEMVDDIVKAFKGRILQLEWMTESTKQYAIEKLDAIRVKIGYPEIWKDHSALDIQPAEKGGSYLQNVMAVASWRFQRDIKRIGMEVDRDEWFMAPQVVNAYYNPMFNEIVFPAAILQPPFFDWQADAAVNYGAIGAVIGHEITHGFDDQGSRFDKEGNLNEWWTPEDRERFHQQTKQLIDQFDAYFPFEDLSLNGTFTLGENIADLGGLSVAYDALQLYYSRHGIPGPIDGFTADQRFFMSWATVWRTKIRPEALRNQIKTDPHPPGMYRAVAAPSNLDKFYQAFDVEPGSKWYRSENERIKIW